MTGNSATDPRRPGKILRYKPPTTESSPTLDDPTPDYMNLLGMIFSMCGLMLKVRLEYSKPRTPFKVNLPFSVQASGEKNRLSISAVVMSYLQNPQPMSPPW
ncbi:PREDICTED: protein Asterix [Nanorana parkeri]|uniref:protein Asterix n=1 Tax=Nanorana parkeri TaxID=125878 RepID=UPI0008546C94|nr:PREDICTED: protein Asterix [Nanorana parkeri]